MITGELANGSRYVEINNVRYGTVGSLLKGCPRLAAAELAQAVNHLAIEDASILVLEPEAGKQLYISRHNDKSIYPLYNVSAFVAPEWVSPTTLVFYTIHEGPLVPYKVTFTRAEGESGQHRCAQELLPLKAEVSDGTR